MLLSEIDAEECGHLIRDVWYNTIFKINDEDTNKYTKNNGQFNDDFNDSLTTLFTDSNFKSKIDKIRQNQDEIANLLVKLKNPPSTWKDAYTELKTYYDDYLTLTELIISPSGNLNTFTSNLNNAISNISKDIKKINNYMKF